MTQDNKKRFSIITKIPKIRSRIVGQSAGFIDRLKRLSKRDIALICAGLGVLILAPVAEHFMMRPSADKLLTPGFGSRKGIGAASELYEPGAGGFAPGMAGTEGDVITPLSARDPSSLIIAPEGFGKPPAPPSSMGLRDAVRGAAKAAVSKAVRSAGAPAPIPKLQASLRGLGTARGGTSASGALAGKEILQQADGAPSKAAKRSSAGPVARADYRGVGYRTRSADGSAFEDLKAKAGAAASHMNEPGAAGALDRTADESVEVGAGTGGVGPGEGEEFSKPSDSSLSHHQAQGEETLAQQIERQRAEKELDLEFSKREFWEIEVPQMIVKSLIENILTEGFIKPLGEEIKDTLWGPTSYPQYACFGIVPGTENLPPHKQCIPANARNPLTISSSKDEIADLAAIPGRCPCGWGRYTAPTTPTTPTTPAPGPETPAQPQTPSTQVDIEDVIGGDTMVGSFVNFDKNVADARTVLEGSDALAIQKAHELLVGAVVSAEEIIKQVDIGIHVVENSMKLLTPAVAELKTLSDGREQQVNTMSGKLNSMAGRQTLSTNFINNHPNPRIRGAYQSLSAAQSTTDFGAKVDVIHTDCLSSKPKILCLADAVPPAAIHWNSNNADRKIGAAEGVLEEENKHIANVEGLTGSLPEGLTGVKGSRDLLVMQVSDANNLLKTVPMTTVILGQVHKILTGEELEISLPEATTVADADLKDAPIDPYIGFRPGVIELLGETEQVEPEKNFSNAFINNPESGVEEPQGYFSMMRMSVRTDAIKENMGTIKSNLGESMNDLLTLAKDFIENARDVDTSLMGTIPGTQPEPTDPNAPPGTQPEPTDPNAPPGTQPEPTDPNVPPGTLPGEPAGPTPEARIASAIVGGEQLYNDYGNQRTLVAYDGWPGNIPKYGNFEEPYQSYVNNKEKIDYLRIDIRGLWRELKKLEGENTPEAAKKAERIFKEMEAKGKEYSDLVKQSNAYIREGLRLNAAGLATFPSVLHNIMLVKGSIRIQLYDDNGKKIQRKGRCLKWTRVTHWYTSRVDWKCTKYQWIDVKAKVPDYYLEYGYGNNPPKYEQVLPQRLRVMAAEPVPAHPEDFCRKPLERAQYSMEIIITCTYSKPSKAWLITSARLRKGKATSSDALGGGVTVTAGGKVGVPLVAEGSLSVGVNINYGHTWNHFRFGDMAEFREFRGKPCFELRGGEVKQ